MLSQFNISSKLHFLSFHFYLYEEHTKTKDFISRGIHREGSKEGRRKKTRESEKKICSSLFIIILSLKCQILKWISMKKSSKVN